MTGIQSILAEPSVLYSIKQGAMSPFFIDDGKKIIKIVSGFLSHLLNLKRAIECDVENSCINTKICLVAVEALEDAYNVLAAPSGSGSLWKWTLSLSSNFLELLDNCNSPALVILAHYAILVGHFENGLWFLEGWSKAVVFAVEGVVTGSWEKWLYWPKQVTLQSFVTRDATEDQAICVHGKQFESR